MNTTLHQRQNFINRYGDPETYEELFYNVLQSIDDQLAGTGLHVAGLGWSIMYSTRLSCTHSAPAGQNTNWSGDNAYPKHYPGWVGRVWIRLNSLLPDDNHPNLSYMFRNTLTHTGTGGYGSYNGPWSNVAKAAYNAATEYHRREVVSYSWDFKIFEQDFPLISANIIKKHLLTIIKTNETPRIDGSNMSWTHPETERKDTELLVAYSDETLDSA